MNLLSGQVEKGKQKQGQACVIDRRVMTRYIEDSAMPKVIVGLFCGTGYNFHTEKNSRVDQSFEKIDEAIQQDDNVAVY